jgi:hypothetical protein
MTRNRIVSALAALALLAVPAVASAHGASGHHGRHHPKKHHLKKAHTREVTGTATATVASFTNNELTITLPNGKSYSGLVTDKTILKCETAAPQSTTAHASRDGDDEQGDDDRNEVNGAKHGAGDDDGDDGDDDGERGRGDINGNGACTTAALTAGAKVSEAALSLKSADATWKKVELIK